MDRRRQTLDPNIRLNKGLMQRVLNELNADPVSDIRPEEYRDKVAIYSEYLGHNRRFKKDGGFSYWVHEAGRRSMIAWTTCNFLLGFYPILASISKADDHTWTGSISHDMSAMGWALTIFSAVMAGLFLLPDDLAEQNQVVLNDLNKKYLIMSVKIEERLSVFERAVNDVRVGEGLKDNIDACRAKLSVL